MSTTKPDSSQIVHSYIGGGSTTVKAVLDGQTRLTDYAALRAYTGTATNLVVTAIDIAGYFVRSATDTTSADNGGTVIVDATLPTGRRWVRNFVGPVQVQWFGTDFTSVQSALTAGAGKAVYFSAGSYLLTGGTPVIPAGTHVMLDPAAIVTQPNKGNFSAFAINPGTTGVTLEGGDIRGPWYGTGPGLWVGKTNSVTVDGDTLADLRENIGIHVRGRWYQREILGYNLATMSALTDTCSHITVRNCRIEGFGQEAILADNVTTFAAKNNNLFKCGRGGVRMYGVVRGDVSQNTIGNMSPGYDGAYPNWNVYGVTATRVQGNTAVPDATLSIFRASQDVSIASNHVYNCHTWKSLDTHGGVDIRFTDNKCSNSYIGLGIDQGGIDTTDGIAPALRTIIKGNIFESSGATYMRAGMALYGHDSATQAADGLVVEGNILIGYGGNDTDGAISLSNVRNAAITGNVIKGAPRAAICMDNVCEEVTIASNVVEDPKSYITVTQNAAGSGYTAAATTCTVSGGGGTGLVVNPNIVGGQVTSYSVVNPGTGYTSAPTVTVVGDGSGATTTVTFNTGYGVLSSTTTARAIIDGNHFINKTQTNTRAISTQTPASGYGLTVTANNTFTGTLTKVFSSVNDLAYGSTFAQMDVASARVTSAGAFTANSRFLDLFRSAAGSYDMVLKDDPTSVNNLVPICGTYTTVGAARATLLGTGGQRLDYDAKSTNFAKGQTVTGGTSGATAVIAGQVDSGTTGSLYLKTIVGTFQDNEAITSVTGAAVANGALQPATILTVNTTNSAGSVADVSFVITVKNISP